MEKTSLGITNELMIKACSFAMKAQTSSSPYFREKKVCQTHVIFAFTGSWSVNEWYSRNPFGDCKIDLSIFPSLRCIGNNEESARVNESFLQQFNTILAKSQLQQKVTRAVAEKKQIIFTGHSSGGAIAILATLWQLEQLRKNQITQHQSQITPLCVTFGSTLVGDRVLVHAIRREDWSNHFVHFVMKYDIVPRVFLSPLSSIERELQMILHLFDPRRRKLRLELVGRSSSEAVDLFSIVLKNTLSATSSAACEFPVCTNLLLGTLRNLTELSPYRPFGTYIFCMENRKLILVKNPDAILQLFSYCLQLGPEQEVTDIASKSLKEHLVYDRELQESLQIQDLICLDNSEELSNLSEASVDDDDERRLSEMAMYELGLSKKARMLLRAAADFEKQKLRNQAAVVAKISTIEEVMTFLHEYQVRCEVSKIGYYDAFKYQKEQGDFMANVKRLELAGIWDEIIEMLRRNELPDDFECQKEWVELGTRYRRLVEPLDVANYYRHSKNSDSGPYMKKGRPKRYRYTQRWLEHANQVTSDNFSESCFWAEVEELCNDVRKGKPFEQMREKILEVEREVLKWCTCGVLKRDVFLEETTFVMWWRKLPSQHKSGSCIARLMNGEGRSLPPIN